MVRWSYVGPPPRLHRIRVSTDIRVPCRSPLSRAIKDEVPGYYMPQVRAPLFLALPSRRLLELLWGACC